MQHVDGLCSPCSTPQASQRCNKLPICWEDVELRREKAYSTQQCSIKCSGYVANLRRSSLLSQQCPNGAAAACFIFCNELCSEPAMYAVDY